MKRESMRLRREIGAREDLQKRGNLAEPSTGTVRHPSRTPNGLPFAGRGGHRRIR